MTTTFVTVEVALQADPAALHRSIAQTLRQHGDPLRWAITAVDQGRQVALVEAVVTVAGLRISHLPVRTV